MMFFEVFEAGNAAAGGRNTALRRVTRRVAQRIRLLGYREWDFLEVSTTMPFGVASLKKTLICLVLQPLGDELHICSTLLCPADTSHNVTSMFFLLNGDIDEFSGSICAPERRANAAQQTIRLGFGASPVSS